MSKSNVLKDLVYLVKSLYEENTTLKQDYLKLTDEYVALMDRFEKLEHEYCCMADKLSLESGEMYDQFIASTGSDYNQGKPVLDGVPIEDMSTTIPEDPDINKGMFTCPGSCAAPMVTGSTSESCYPLTAVLGELSIGVSVSKRILTEKGLFAYQKDENGNNRYMPTDWFKKFGLEHGIIAEFIGHAKTKSGQKKYTWYKVTHKGKQVILDTVNGLVDWETRPSEK